jgi:phage protein D
MDNPLYAPEFEVTIRNAPVPVALRRVMSSVSFTTGLEGADRVEITIANQALRWLDDPLLAISDDTKLGNELKLGMGYAGAVVPMFVGDISGVGASFPSSGVPQLTITAQDRRHRLQQGTRAKWHNTPKPDYGNLPKDDQQVTREVAGQEQYGLDVAQDPIGAKLSQLVTAATAALATDPDSAQKAVRRQVQQSDYDFLRQLARESGLEMVIDHADPNGGHKLRFFSPLDRLDADVELTYGVSLIEFTPRESNVGQVKSVRANVWEPSSKKPVGLALSVGDNDTTLTLAVNDGGPAPGDTGSAVVLDEPLTQATAPRRLVSELMPRLNERLTGSGSTVGDPRIRAGTVLRLAGLGERFGGLYRVTSATHTIDTGGYRTRFDVRKEIWFNSVSKTDQKAVRVARPIVLKF